MSRLTERQKALIESNRIEIIGNELHYGRYHARREGGCWSLYRLRSGHRYAPRWQYITVEEIIEHLQRAKDAFDFEPN